MKEELPDYHQAWAEFAHFTGWRVKSEVLPLQWSQVNFDAGVVRLEPGTTKSGRGRTFPFDIFPELKALLEKQRKYTDPWQAARLWASPSPSSLCSAGDRPWTQSDFVSTLSSLHSLV